LSEIIGGIRHSVCLAKLTQPTQNTKYSRLLTEWVIPSCHHACAVQQWRHCLTASVKVSGECFKHSQ